MITVSGTSISDVFHQMLFKFFEKDEAENYINAYVTDIDAGSFGKDKMGDEGGVQQRLQADLAVAEINYPEARPLGVVFPENSGIPPVCTQESIEEYFSSYLMNAELSKNETYTYGSRILEFPHFTDGGRCGYERQGAGYTKEKFNQLDWIIKHFKAAPGNNHCCVEIAKGDDVLLKHAPCLRLISFKIVNGKLNITVFFRSWDFWSGFPTNLGGIQLLNEYVASEIGIKTGKMFAVSDGLHVYTHNVQFALERLGR
jgi:thymidylate synthase